MNKNDIISITADWTCWWIKQRENKLREHLSDTMSVNPFLLPILFEIHNIDNFGELSDLIVNGHLLVGHNTGFGKLIDEKILPEVFGTVKLDRKFRRRYKPFIEPCFNEIDHVIKRSDGSTDLLSLKAGKWTIQLTMAMQLNHSFDEILTRYGEMFSEIAVGVFYGSKEGLTDKYDILRGINRGAHHDVIDLTDNVSVYAGRQFWSWLNGDEDQTQDWVLEGILAGIKVSQTGEETGRLLESYRKKISSSYSKFVSTDGSVDWNLLLKSINK